MKKFIYHSHKVRCAVKYISDFNHIVLQIQERRFFVFWVNVHRWMTVQEGFWGECDRRPMLRMSYSSGNITEVWRTGTLDLEGRIKEFFAEYFQQKDKEVAMNNRVKGLMTNLKQT